MRELFQIIDLLVAGINKRLAERNISIELTERAKEHLVRLGYDPAYGARQLKRTLQKHLETPLANLIIKGEIKDGQRVLVDLSEEGNLVFKPITS